LGLTRVRLGGPVSGPVREDRVWPASVVPPVALSELAVSSDSDPVPRVPEALTPIVRATGPTLVSTTRSERSGAHTANW
jgi:hypothetical protein